MARAWSGGGSGMHGVARMRSYHGCRRDACILCDLLRRRRQLWGRHQQVAVALGGRQRLHRAGLHGPSIRIHGIVAGARRDRHLVSEGTVSTRVAAPIAAMWRQGCRRRAARRSAGYCWRQRRRSPAARPWSAGAATEQPCFKFWRRAAAEENGREVREGPGERPESLRPVRQRRPRRLPRVHRSGDHDHLPAACQRKERQEARHPPGPDPQSLYREGGAGRSGASCGRALRDGASC
mmetsp:Transcript_40409/g.91217  ORF Transcript_40409/g.91217 Transcript_40409/m.91217 type:complete len:237 (-) Transcript_40409:276-986(-)